MMDNGKHGEQIFLPRSYNILRICTATDEIVALKQIKFDSALIKDGFPMATLREIGVLLTLSHECIVTVKEMVIGSSFDKVFIA